MELAIETESSKKNNFEELSKEDLVHKCYHLLTIAQKAKHSKNIMQEEIDELKDALEKTKSLSSGTEEIINNLTQKNLRLTMTLDELTNGKSLCQKLEKYEIELRENEEKINLLDNENCSFKRQINRLTEENEQLLENLDSLEKQIQKLNHLAQEQQNQLLQLEKQQNIEKYDKSSDDSNQMFLNEILILRSEKEEITNRLYDFEKKLSQNGIIINNLETELGNRNESISNLSSKVHELQNTLGENIDNCKKEEIRFSIENKTIKEKLKLYHAKIVKFAGIIKILREDKSHIMKLSKSYTDQVVVWRNQLQFAKDKCLVYIKNLEVENEHLKKKLEDLDENQQKLLSSLEEKKIQEMELNNKISDYQSEISNSKAISNNQIFTLEKKLEDSLQVNLQLKHEIDKKLLEIDGYKTEIEEMQNERKSYKDDIINNRDSHKFNLVSAQDFHVQNQEMILKKEDINQKINNPELNLSSHLKNALEQIEQYQLEQNDFEKERENSTKQISDLKNRILFYENELTSLKSDHATLCDSEKYILNELKSLQIEKDNFLAISEDVNHKYKILLGDHEKKVSNYEKILADLRNEINSYKELGIKSSQEIEKLLQENNILSSENEQLKQEKIHLNDLQNNLSDGDCQTDLPLSTELEQQVCDLKQENAELLSDMNEMNQELKERGENISKLEAHYEEVLKKLQVYESQANKNSENINEKEKVIENLTKEIQKLTLNKSDGNNEEISQLKAEIDILKEKLNSNPDSSYVDTETMSTSTISKCEEMNRLKDLEGSWEERYGKLRNLAIKLKGKIRELNISLTQQQNENEELQKKVTVNIKTIQNMQMKCDNLEDDLDKSQKESKQYLNRLNQIAHDISKDKQQLASKDEIINDLNQKIEQLIKEKQSTENWKKQVGAKVQTLRKDLESKELLKKELESKITELNSELHKKDEQIRIESESHNQTKAILDQLNDQSKKNSMLNLEMQDYERSMKEITKKLDKQQEQIATLKNQIESQKLTIETLKEENKTLEDKLLKEEHNLLTVTSEIGMFKNKIVKYEASLKDKDEKIESYIKLLESSRAKVEELSIELTTTISEHQKTNENLKTERDHLRSQSAIFQQNLRDLQDELNMKIELLDKIQKDYEGYKIRAQSVLRQSQSRDVGSEEKLLEEVNSLKTKNACLCTDLDKYK